MPATITHDALDDADRHQLKAVLHGLTGERDELRLAEIVALSDIDGDTVRAVMQDLTDDSDSPIVRVDDGVWRADHA